MEKVFDDNTERGFVVVRAESENGRETGKRGKGKKLFLSPLHLFSLSSPLSNNFFSSLAQAPRLALRLEQREDVALADGALDVAHDEAVLVVEELDADLGDLQDAEGASKGREAFGGAHAARREDGSLSLPPRPCSPPSLAPGRESRSDR